jgi:phosphatidylserine decarboxylase
MVEERIPLAKEGIPFVAAAAFVSFVCAVSGHALAAYGFCLLALLCLIFFRDPERSFTTERGAVISPADGKIVYLSGPSGEGFKLSIFMRPWDVHINRAPVDSVVTHVEYIPGRFRAAQGMKASLENERNALTLQMDDGNKVVMIQVAGVLARRIVCRARVGDRLSTGERYGLIRFGSRVDLILPSHFVPRVRYGDRVRAGQTTLGIL